MVFDGYMSEWVVRGGVSRVGVERNPKSLHETNTPTTGFSYPR